MKSACDWLTTDRGHETLLLIMQCLDPSAVGVSFFLGGGGVACVEGKKVERYATVLEWNKTRYLCLVVDGNHVLLWV